MKLASVFVSSKQKPGNKATLWQAYGATTHCHQDKPGLLSSASLGWQQTSSWLALAARGNKSGLGMRLQMYGYEAIVVWVWSYSGLGMRLQQYEYEAAVAWDEATAVWVWGYSGLGMKLQQSGTEATVVWEWGYSLPCSVLLPQHSWGPKGRSLLLHRPQLILYKW